VAVFRFKLQPVLDQRLREERERQRAVAELEAQRLEVEERIRADARSIRAEKEELRDRLAAAKSFGGAGVDLGGVRMQANASLHMVARTQQRVLQLAGIHKRIDRARLELLEATTRRRAVELLKERRHAEWKAAIDRRENAEQDDLVQRGVAARAGGEPW
jgi:flagellar export protein FliJ